MTIRLKRWVRELLCGLDRLLLGLVMSAGALVTERKVVSAMKKTPAERAHDAHNNESCDADNTEC